MAKQTIVLVSLIVLSVSGPLVAAEAEAPQAASQSWLTHTIEGVGGGWFVPSAYLMNPGPKDGILGLPSVSSTFIGGFSGSHKKLYSFAVSETLFNRVELSYAVNRVDLSTLRHTIQDVIPGNDIGRDEVHLNNWNLRLLLLEEDSFDLPLPAITGGVHFKQNCNIEAINNQFFVPMDVMGYERASGVDWTLTGTKSIRIDPLPLIVATAGLRISDASNIGYMGFGDHHNVTVETSVSVVPCDRLMFSYEFRRKERAFSAPPVSGMIDGEENWHGVSASVRLWDHLTVKAGVLWMGNVADGQGDNAIGMQIQYDF